MQRMLASLKLEAFIILNNLNAASFGKMLGCRSETIRRYVKSLRIPNDEVKIKIEKVTKGQVEITDWFKSI